MGIANLRLDMQASFSRFWLDMEEAVHETAIEHGWWEANGVTYDPQAFNKGEKIALIHSELSEALEALRGQKPEHSTKIPEFLHVEEELADAVIRIMDMAAAYGYDVGNAIIAKAKYNDTREHKHGGKKF